MGYASTAYAVAGSVLLGALIVLVLSVESSSLTINAAEGDRFYLVINFNGADGEYVIEKNITN